MGTLYIDERGIATPQRPMTLQENYGMPPNVSAGRIPYTGSGQPVGAPSGISRPGIATGAQNAAQVPVNPRRLPSLRTGTAPIASTPAAPPATNPARGFTMGSSGATVSPARPTKPVAQISYSPREPLENIDADVRARIGSGSRRFVGPQQPEVMPIATPGNSVIFGGRGGAQPVLPGGGIAGELYRRWSGRTGRYIPGLEQMWGGKQTTYRELTDLVRGEMQRQADSSAGQEVRQQLPPRASASLPIAGAPVAPIDAPLRYENLGLGPNDLSRTSTGRVPTPIKPVGIAGGDGTGFAIVGGKKVNYQDIGTRQDPLASRRTDGIATAPDGQTILLGNAAGYHPSRDVDWSPGSANERNAQLAAADRLGMVYDSGQSNIQQTSTQPQGIARPLSNVEKMAAWANTTGNVRPQTVTASNNAPVTPNIAGFRPMRQWERDAAGLTTKQEYLTHNNQDIQNQLAAISANMGNQYDGDQKIEAARMRIAALQVE
jgi:hypothetical protein